MDWRWGTESMWALRARRPSARELQSGWGWSGPHAATANLKGGTAQSEGLLGKTLLITCFKQFERRNSSLNGLHLRGDEPAHSSVWRQHRDGSWRATFDPSAWLPTWRAQLDEALRCISMLQHRAGWKSTVGHRHCLQKLLLISVQGGRTWRLESRATLIREQGNLLMVDPPFSTLS